MKKLISIILAVLTVVCFSSVAVSADSGDGITISVETKNIKAGINYEDVFLVTVSGSWSDCDAMDIFMEYDAEALELRKADGVADALMELCFPLEDGKVQYSASFDSKSSNGNIEIFECYFNAKKLGDTQLRFSAMAPAAINGQSEFTISVAGLDTVDRNDLFEFEVSDSEVTLRDAYSAATDENGLLVIPAEINGMPVTAIANNFVTYNESVKNVVIPASVTDIGAYALLQCQNLKNIFVLSDSANIDSSAFGWINGEEYDKSLTIHGKKGSTAENYAKEKGMFFHECSEYHESEEFSLADVNADGNITAADARLALRAAAKLETLTPAQFSAADIMRNATVNAADARIILRIAAKLESIEIYR